MQEPRRDATDCQSMRLPSQTRLHTTVELEARHVAVPTLEGLSPTRTRTFFWQCVQRLFATGCSWPVFLLNATPAKFDDRRCKQERMGGSAAVARRSDVPIGIRTLRDSSEGQAVERARGWVPSGGCQVSSVGEETEYGRLGTRGGGRPSYGDRLLRAGVRPSPAQDGTASPRRVPVSQ